MRLSLAISIALLCGSYVIAIPLWPYDNGEASGSGSGNNFGAPAPHDNTHFPPPNHPPPDHPPRFHPTFGYLPDPDHQLQPYQPPPAQQLDATHPPPNHPPPGHPSLGHHNLDNFPGPPEGPPPLHQVLGLGDSRGGLFGLPYRCTGCGRHSPAPEPEPGPGVNHPVPNAPVNRNNRNPFTRTGQGGADRRGSSTRARRNKAYPYARPNRSGANGSGARGSGGAVSVPVDGPSGGGPGKLQCPESGCRYSTKRKSDLTLHAASHSTARNHACPNCDATFKGRSALRKHYRARHPGFVLPRPGIRRG